MENIACPKCGSNDTKPQKSWTMHNPKADTKTTITIHLCRECGHKFRKGERVQEE